MDLDPTTILAVISCAAVFLAWLVLPHSAPPARAARPAEQLEKIPVSAA